jgi:hypothetical protein
VARAAEAIAEGYGDRNPLEPDELYRAAAVVLDDAADYWTSIGVMAESVPRARWRAAWFREQVADR